MLPTTLGRAGSTSTTERAPDDPFLQGATTPPVPTKPRDPIVGLATTDKLVAEIQTLLQQLRTQLRAPAPVTGGLLLAAPDCLRLEDTLGLGASQSVATLVQAVERLASMKIGDIRIPFSPGQLAELQHRAGKRGRTVAAEMEAVVKRIEDELFYKGA